MTPHTTHDTRHTPHDALHITLALTHMYTLTHVRAYTVTQVHNYALAHLHGCTRSHTTHSSVYTCNARTQAGISADLCCFELLLPRPDGCLHIAAMECWRLGCVFWHQQSRDRQLVLTDFAEYWSAATARTCTLSVKEYAAPTSQRDLMARYSKWDTSAVDLPSDADSEQERMSVPDQEDSCASEDTLALPAVEDGSGMCKAGLALLAMMLVARCAHLPSVGTRRQASCTARTSMLLASWKTAEACATLVMLVAMLLTRCAFRSSAGSRSPSPRSWAP